MVSSRCIHGMKVNRFEAGGGMRIYYYCGRAVSNAEHFGPLPEDTT